MPEPESTIKRSEMRDAVRRSGYLLEGRVADSLAKCGFHVATNPAYPDPITGKSRELDLTARGAFIDPSEESDDRAEDLVSAELIVECIHPPQPVAFFTRVYDRSYDRSDDRVAFVGSHIWVGEQRRRVSWNWLLRLELLKCRFHHFVEPLHIATQFCSFDRKKSGQAREWFATHRDEDHEAFRKLLDFTQYTREAYAIGMDSDYGELQFVFFFPILVIQGQLYQVEVRGKGMRVTRTQHVRYWRDAASGRGESRYHVDVVVSSPSRLTM